MILSFAVNTDEALNAVFSVEHDFHKIGIVFDTQYNTFIPRRQDWFLDDSFKSVNPSLKLDKKELGDWIEVSVDLSNEDEKSILLEIENKMRNLVSDFNVETVDDKQIRVWRIKNVSV